MKNTPNATDFNNLAPETQLELMRQHPELVTQYWGEVLRIDEFNLPDFPLNCLPPVLADFAAAVSHSVQTSPDMAAVASMCTISCCVHDKYNIRLKHDWIEPIGLYCLIISPSGTGKSQIIRAMAKPIYEFEQQMSREFADEIIASEVHEKALNSRAEHLTKQISKKPELEEELKKVQKELKEFKPVRIPRRILDDTTPEQLISVMNANGGYTSIISAESTIFDNMAGRYSGGIINIDAFLKAYSGDLIIVNRRGREERLFNPRLTMLVSTQPDTFDDIRNNKNFLGKGLLSRLLYSTPKLPMKQTFYTDPIPQKVRDNYNSLCKMLLGLPYSGFSLIDIDEDARKMFADLYEKVSAVKFKDLDYMTDWANKFCGNVARIAAVLYLAEQTVFTEREPLPGRIMRNAILIGEYFLEHTKKVYLNVGAGETAKLVAHIIKKLKEKRPYIITKYEIFRFCRGKVSSVKDLDEPINTLIEHGYLRVHPEEPTDNPRGGRKKEPRFALNPIYFNLL